MGKIFQRGDFTFVTKTFSHTKVKVNSNNKNEKRNEKNHTLTKIDCWMGACVCFLVQQKKDV